LCSCSHAAVLFSSSSACATASSISRTRPVRRFVKLLLASVLSAARSLRRLCPSSSSRSASARLRQARPQCISASCQPSPRPLELSPVAKVPCKLSLPRLSSLSTSTDFRLPAFAPRAASSSASRSRQPKVSASSASFVPASLPARLLLVYVRASVTPYRLELASKPALYFPR
jgi:hypothetical protein